MAGNWERMASESSRNQTYRYLLLMRPKPANVNFACCHCVEQRGFGENFRVPKKRAASEEGQEYARSDVSKLIAVLRRDILNKEPGTHLGLEEDLLKQYGVSRPTLRQAVRVLEHEKLIAVRRGWSGGYYARRPADRDMVESATLILQVHNCTMPQAMDAGFAILSAISKAAAISADDEAKSELRSFIAQYQSFDVTSRSLKDFMRLEVEMAERIGKLANNPALLFFLEIIYEFGVRRIGLRTFEERPDRMEAEIQITAKVASAICDGEIEIADVFMTRKEEMILSWFREDGVATGS